MAPPSFLKKTVDFLENNPRYKGVVTRSIVFNEKLTEDSYVILNQHSFNPWLKSIHIADIAQANMFPPISFLFSRKALEKVGFFDEDLIVLGDWDFNLRFLEKFDIGVMPEELAYYYHRTKISKGQEDYGNSVIHRRDEHIKIQCDCQK